MMGLRAKLAALIAGKPPTGHEAIKGAKPRSSRWPAVRAVWLKQHPKCAACGNTTLKLLNVHHIKLFSDRPDLELDFGNFVTLCEDGPGKMSCHFTFGHLGLTWSDGNPDVERDALRYRIARDSAVDRRGVT